MNDIIDKLSKSSRLFKNKSISIYDAENANILFYCCHDYCKLSKYCIYAERDIMVMKYILEKYKNEPDKYDINHKNIYNLTAIFYYFNQCNGIEMVNLLIENGAIIDDEVLTKENIDKYDLIDFLQCNIDTLKNYKKIVDILVNEIKCETDLLYLFNRTNNKYILQKLFDKYVEMEINENQLTLYHEIIKNKIVNDKTKNALKNILQDNIIINNMSYLHLKYVIDEFKKHLNKIYKNKASINKIVKAFINTNKTCLKLNDLDAYKYAVELGAETNINDALKNVHDYNIIKYIIDESKKNPQIILSKILNEKIINMQDKNEILKEIKEYEELEAKYNNSGENDDREFDDEFNDEFEELDNESDDYRVEIGSNEIKRDKKTLEHIVTLNLTDAETKKIEKTEYEIIKTHIGSDFIEKNGMIVTKYNRLFHIDDPKILKLYLDNGLIIKDDDSISALYYVQIRCVCDIVDTDYISCEQDLDEVKKFNKILYDKYELKKDLNTDLKDISTDICICHEYYEEHSAYCCYKVQKEYEIMKLIINSCKVNRIFENMFCVNYFEKYSMPFIELLLKNGLDINGTISDKKEFNGDNVLCLTNDTEVFEFLIKKGANILHINNNKNNLFHIFINDIEIIDLLIKYFPKEKLDEYMHMSNNKGNLPLYYIHKDYFKDIRHYIKRGFNPNRITLNGEISMYDKFLSHDLFIKNLLENDIDVTFNNSYKHETFINSLKEIEKYHDLKKVIYKKNKKNESIIFYSDYRTTKYIIKYYNDKCLYERDANGCTPLYYTNDIQKINLLIQNGVDVNNINNDGETVFTMPNISINLFEHYICQCGANLDVSYCKNIQNNGTKKSATFYDFLRDTKNPIYRDKKFYVKNLEILTKSNSKSANKK